MICKGGVALPHKIKDAMVTSPRTNVFYMLEWDVFYSWVCTEVYSSSHCVYLHQSWSLFSGDGKEKTHQYQ